MIKKAFFTVYILFSVLLLVYLIWPYAPVSVYQFSPLPNSVQSKLSGDTTEVYNLKAYFSNNYRNFVTSYYSKEYQYFTKLPFGPLRFNHPPETAFKYVKIQTQSTYLEEYTYPMRDRLFINGLEPFDEETGEGRYDGSTEFTQDGEKFETKVIIRYYPSSYLARISTWIGINISVFLLYVMTKKVIYNA